MSTWIEIVLSVLGGGIAAGTVFYVLGRRVERRVADATARLSAGERERQLADARARVELEAREELIRAREDLEKDLAERRREVDRRHSAIEKTQSTMAEREREVTRREQSFTDRERTLAGREQEARAQLERLAGLSAQDAKEELKRRLEEEARGEASAMLRDIREQAQKSADREAKKIVALAIQRIAADHTAETTVSAVALPSDEMKGRIIGREGRNIRAFEAATGADVIIDDTPDTVVISCFDPVRREVARLALERLITDGRIHPGRIEEVVRKAQEEIEAGIVESGRTGRVRDRPARHAPGAGQAGRTHALPHLLRPEHPGALQGSRLDGGHHGRRAEARRAARQARRRCCTTSARCSPTSTTAPTSSWASKSRRSTASTRWSSTASPPTTTTSRTISAISVIVQAADAVSGVAARARAAKRSRPTSSG